MKQLCLRVFGRESWFSATRDANPRLNISSNVPRRHATVNTMLLGGNHVPCDDPSSALWFAQDG